MVNGWTDFVQRLLPPACVLCGAPGQPPAIDLCAACERDLPLNHPACPRCGEPLKGNLAPDALCGVCLRRLPRYHSSFCAYRYAWPVDQLIRTVKYHGGLPQARVLGELLARRLMEVRATPWPQLIVPMPLSEERYRERGYNQATEVGLAVARCLHIPLQADLVLRARHTKEQAVLSRKERKANVHGAFAMARECPATHVAILDDVVTTGSTVNELSRILRRAGVGLIEVWALAHTEQ